MASTSTALAVSIAVASLLSIPALAAQAPTDSWQTLDTAPHLQLQPSYNDHSVLAGFADFGLRLGEGVAVTGGLGLAGSSFGGENGLLPGAMMVVGIGLAGIALLGMPAVDALVLQHIGNSDGAGHLLAPLMITSYVSHLVVDLATLILIGVSQPAAALLVYLLGSGAGSSVMGYVHHESAFAHASAAPAPPAPSIPWTTAAREPSIPTSLAPGYAVRF